MVNLQRSGGGEYGGATPCFLLFHRAKMAAHWLGLRSDDVFAEPCLVQLSTLSGFFQPEEKVVLHHHQIGPQPRPSASFLPASSGLPWPGSSCFMWAGEWGEWGRLEVVGWRPPPTPDPPLKTLVLMWGGGCGGCVGVGSQGGVTY